MLFSLKTLKICGLCVAPEGMLITAAPHLGKKQVCGTAHSTFSIVSSVKRHVSTLRLDCLHNDNYYKREDSIERCLCDWHMWPMKSSHHTRNTGWASHLASQRNWGKTQAITGGVASISEHRANRTPCWTISCYLGPVKHPISTLSLSQAKLDLWD